MLGMSLATIFGTLDCLLTGCWSGMMSYFRRKKRSDSEKVSLCSSSISNTDTQKISSNVLINQSLQIIVGGASKAFDTRGSYDSALNSMATKNWLESSKVFPYRPHAPK